MRGGREESKVSSLLDNMPHTATAKRRTRTVDSIGGAVDTWTVLFADRACWRQQAGDSESDSYEQRGISVTNKVYFASDPGLDERDVLVVNGDTMEVVSRPRKDASAGLGVLWRVNVNQVSQTGSV